MWPPSSGSSGMKLNSATNRLTTPSRVSSAAQRSVLLIVSSDATSPATRLAPTTLIGLFGSRSSSPKAASNTPYIRSGMCISASPVCCV